MKPDRCRVLPLLLIALHLVGCSSPLPPVAAMPTINPVKTRAGNPAPPLEGIDDERRASGSLLLGHGDELRLLVFDEPDLSLTSAQVRPDGKISVPLLGSIRASGRTPDQLAREVERRLLRYVVTARVSVMVNKLASQRFSMLGAVNKPGLFSIDGPTRILDALALAGGLGRRDINGRSVAAGDLSRAVFVRGRRVIPVDFSAVVAGRAPHHNILLRAADYMYVPPLETRQVYVLGEVAKPRVLQLERPIPLVEVLAAAGGLKKDAREGAVKVIRGSLARPEVIDVSVDKLMEGKALDVLVRGGDIVYVPTHPLAKWNWVLTNMLPGLRELMLAKAFSGG
jgi:polysaccharide biosynthesis/export protein